MNWDWYFIVIEIFLYLRFGFSRVTSDKSAEMKDLTYIKLVDLDKSSCNKIILEHSSENCVKAFECPHHIIVGLIKIISEVIRQARDKEDPANELIKQNIPKEDNTPKLLEEYHEDLMKTLKGIKEEILELKSKL